MRNRELEQAIVDDPSEVRAWTVYADWLQTQADPWAERLSSSLALATAKGPNKAKLEAAIAAIDEPPRAALFGETLAEWMKHEDFESVVTLERAHGFIVGASLSGPPSDDFTADQVLHALVRSPGARLLRSLTIGLLDDEYPVSLHAAVEAIRGAEPLEAMRELFIGDFEFPDQQEISWVEVGDVADALAVMPNLRSLHLRGANIGLGTALELAKLETLRIETGGLPAAAVEAIGNCRLPNLRTMEVWLGTDDYGGDGTIEMLARLFTGEGLPKLVHLGLMNSEFENDIAVALADSPLLAQLRVVDLSMGTLDDEGAEAILAAVDRFKHLEQLDLEHHYMSDELANALREALGKLVIIGKRERGGDDDRYTQVGE